jgi:hypothetical protein
MLVGTAQEIKNEWARGHMASEARGIASGSFRHTRAIPLLQNLELAHPCSGNGGRVGACQT